MRHMAINNKLSIESQHRFWEKVQVIPFHSCWEWVAARNEYGYGVFGIGKQTDKAHRISFRLLVGEIPKGKFICHKCDNPSCVNPNHLFVGTGADNVKDMIEKKRNSPPPNMGGWNRIDIDKKLYKLLGKMPDTHLAKLASCSKCSIRRIRKSMKISSYPCQTRFKKGG